MKVMLDPGAYMPEYAHETDAGADLRSPVDAVIWPHDSVNEVKYYTCTEFADRYNVTRQTVIHHIKRGTIQAELSPAGIYMIPENAAVPPAWTHGEKGRVANARYGVTDES